MGEIENVVKQKNDVDLKPRNWRRRLKITVVLLLVSGLGLLVNSIAMPRRIDDGGLSFDIKIRFPLEAKSFHPFCIFIDSLGDEVVVDAPHENSFGPLGWHSLSSMIENSEITTNDVKTPPENLEWTYVKRFPATMYVCDPQGLNTGVYQMGFKLKNLSYKWVLLVTP